jgi:hypothetical protein
MIGDLHFHPRKRTAVGVEGLLWRIWINFQDYPLQQAPPALCCVRERGVLGKIVLVTSRYSADTTA